MVMATHTLLPAATTSTPPLFSTGKKLIAFQAKPQALSASLKLNGVRASSNLAAGSNRIFCHKDDDNSIRRSRRDCTLGFCGALVALMTMAVDNNSTAAARRPPPPPPPEEKEKKDPNISDVMAKVLASRKRKEAMKQAMAKQREKGKPIPTASQ